MTPDISVVIPVFNEEQGLPLLCARLFPALDALRRPYEIIFVDDGSRDGSAAVLRAQKFSSVRTLSITVSSSASANMFLSRAFSCSN